MSQVHNVTYVPVLIAIAGFCAKAPAEPQSPMKIATRRRRDTLLLLEETEPRTLRCRRIDFQNVFAGKTAGVYGDISEPLQGGWFKGALFGSEFVAEIVFHACRLLAGENAVIDQDLADLAVEVFVVDPQADCAGAGHATERR